jgi:putative transposase
LIEFCRPALAGLSESARQLALDRFRVLRPCLEDCVSLAEVARQHGLQLRRLQRWMRAYRRDGLAGLARKPYSDRGHPTLSGPLRQVIEGLALRRPRLSCAAVHREVVALAIDRGWRAPSYDTVYSVIRRLDPALVTLAHGGAKVYADRYDLL